MTGAAQRVCQRQVASLGATGVLTAVDADALRAYCEAVDRYVVAAELLARSGPLVTGARSGELVKNPLHQIVRDDAMLIRLFARDLGFVPTAREGLRTPGDDADPLEAWLAGTVGG